MSLLHSGGYKGYGLGMMVEVFCGILAGAQYSKNIRTWKETNRVADLVCLFVCLLVCLVLHILTFKTFTFISMFFLCENMIKIT